MIRDRVGWDYYRGLFRRRWTTLVGAVVAGALGGTGCSALIIYLIHRQLSGQANTGLFLPLLYVGSIGLYLVLSSLSEYLLYSLAQDELRELRVRLSRRVLSLPLERVEELGSARIMASLTDDLDRVTKSIRKITALTLSGSMVLGVAAYLVWLSPVLFAVTAALLTLGIQLYRWPLRRLDLLQRYWARLREGWDTLLRHYEGVTQGTKELLMHRDRRKAFVEEALAETCSEMRDDAVKGGTWQNLFFRFGEVLYYVVLGVILFLLPRVGAMDPELLTGYVIAGLYALVPISSIINFGPNFGEARVSLRRLAELGVFLDDEDPAPRGVASVDPDGLPDPAPGSRLGGNPSPPHLVLESVTYHYRRELDDEPFLLGPIDLELRPGELTFLTGGNGSGKTTLFKLMAGLYRPESGRILIDGTEVTDASREEYRQHFSVLFTDFHLFDRLYGLDPDVVDRRAATWLQRLELDRKVQVRGGHLSTTDLSHGQRKRLALLTAYLEDRPAYFFDEWAADQDPHFKEIFYTQLLPELKAEGRTVLVVTHDDRWYPVADRVLKLVDGRLTVGE